MIHYKDMTFCKEFKACKLGTVCRRAYTDEVHAEAEKANLPVCTYVEPPHCFVYKEVTDD